MDRIEEAINIVHLLADQPPMYDDRRRIFPLVVRTLARVSRQSTMSIRCSCLVATDSKGSGQVSGSERAISFRGSVEVRHQERSSIVHRHPRLSQRTDQVMSLVVLLNRQDNSSRHCILADVEA